MKITWENVDDFELVRKSFRNKKTGEVGWHLLEHCKGCGEPHFSKTKHSKYCSNKCQLKYQKHNNKNKWNIQSVRNFIENQIGLILLSVEFNGYSETLEVKCPKCGFIWNPLFSNLRKGQTKCIKCLGKHTGDWQEVIDLFNSYNFELLSKQEEYKSANFTKLKYKCKKCGTEDEVTYTQLKAKGKTCWKCNKKRISPNKIQFSDIKQWFEDENWIVISTEKDYKNQNETPIHCICPKGHEQWKSVRKWRIGRRCPYCMTSGPELELRKFIESLGYQVSFNDRNILNGKELDFFFPSINKAIEFNGNYWHCNYNIYPSTYYNQHKGLYANELWVIDGIKRRLCRKKNIDFTTIWENEWNLYKNTVKNNIIIFLNK